MCDCRIWFRGPTEEKALASWELYVKTERLRGQKARA